MNCKVNNQLPPTFDSQKTDIRYIHAPRQEFETKFFVTLSWQAQVTSNLYLESCLDFAPFFPSLAGDFERDLERSLDFELKIRKINTSIFLFSNDTDSVFGISTWVVTELVLSWDEDIKKTLHNPKKQMRKRNNFD